MVLSPDTIVPILVGQAVQAAVWLSTGRKSNAILKEQNELLREQNGLLDRPNNQTPNG